MAKNKIYIPTFISSVNYAPARVLPHIYFYNGLKVSETWYLQGYQNGNTGSVVSHPLESFPYVDNYEGQDPTSGSKSLLFYNEPAVYGTTPTGSLYSEYWQTYISLLYNPRTRLFNCEAIIPLADYFKMELNDIVEWRGNYYHLRAINDYNLKNGECKLQLLGPILGDILPNILPAIACDFTFDFGCPPATTTKSPTTTTVPPTTSTTTITPTTSTTTIAPYCTCQSVRFTNNHTRLFAQLTYTPCGTSTPVTTYVAKQSTLTVCLATTPGFSYPTGTDFFYTILGSCTVPECTPTTTTTIAPTTTTTTAAPTTTTTTAVPTTSTTTTETPCESVTVGSSYGGGKVFSIQGNTIYIAAVNDLTSSAGSPLMSWGCQGTYIAGATGSGWGEGLQNSLDIEAGCATANIAARVALSASINGYDDWYLPTLDELQGLWSQRGLSPFVSSSVPYYWTSRQWTDQYATAVVATDGSESNINSKNNTYRVKAIRKVVCPNIPTTTTTIAPTTTTTASPYTFRAVGCCDSASYYVGWTYSTSPALPQAVFYNPVVGQCMTIVENVVSQSVTMTISSSAQYTSLVYGYGTEEQCPRCISLRPAPCPTTTTTTLAPTTTTTTISGSCSTYQITNSSPSLAGQVTYVPCGGIGYRDISVAQSSTITLCVQSGQIQNVSGYASSSLTNLGTPCTSSLQDCISYTITNSGATQYTYSGKNCSNCSTTLYNINAGASVVRCFVSGTFSTSTPSFVTATAGANCNVSGSGCPI